MDLGWVKLHRSLIDWEWYSDINTTRLFVHLLLTANHKDNNWRGITIKRGSRLTSLDKLSTETNLSVSKIRTSIKKLILTNEIASESHTQHTVFIIKNYDDYQTSDKQNDKPVTNESQTNDKPIATNKNVKNENNANKTTCTKFSTCHLDFAKGMYSLILNVAEKAKKPNFEKWAEVIRKMEEVDKLNLEEMSVVFKWANSDSFWSTNILSPTKFRDKYSQLQAKMKNSNRVSAPTQKNIDVAKRFLNGNLNDE